MRKLPGIDKLTINAFLRPRLATINMVTINTAAITLLPRSFNKFKTLLESS